MTDTPTSHQARTVAPVPTTSQQTTPIAMTIDQASPARTTSSSSGPDRTPAAPEQVARGSVVPARLRIVGWIMLTTALGLTALVVTVRSALLADVARQANADVVQEAEELREFVAEGRNPETARPFTSTEALLDVYLRRQRAGSGETLLGYLRDTDEVTRTRQTDKDDRDAYDLAADGRVLRPIIDGPATSGVVQTPRGQMRWGRVDLAAGRSGDGGGALVVAEFTAGATATVDRTTRLIVGVGVGALLLTAGIAWLVAGQILRPVRTVRRAAAEITERDLTRRIQVQGRDDVAALATTFNGMLDRLEDAFGTQRRFVDDASHELRTPITIVRGHLELLSDDPAERESTIGLVLGELDRMNRIVSDLLVLAKAERPDFVRLEVVDVTALTLEIDAKVQALADRRFTLAHVADGTARLDAQRVTQAVLQLAQNAVQHTQHGAEIRVASTFRAGVDGESGPTVEFSVTDYGPGVQPAEAATIFERFAHGSAGVHHGQRAGAGLGLAIVRAIADGHDGSAFVQSDPGRGATFGISLPAREVHRHEATEDDVLESVTSFGTVPIPTRPEKSQG